MKPRLLRGRFFTAADDERSLRVAVVNQTMAQRFWAGQEAIGKRFRSADVKDEWLEIVGIVQDAKVQGLFGDREPYFYVPIAQQYRAMQTLQVRTAGDPMAL